MSLWGNKDQANNKPKFVGAANLALVTGMTVAEAQANTGVANPGWVQVTTGKGGVVSVAITGGGTGYANGEPVVAANTYGDGFAATIGTNGSGVITSVNVSARGQYSQAPALTITTAAGTTGALTATVGGRAGRVFKETLVAMGSIS